MATALYRISPATSRDLPQVARIQYQACASDPGFNAIFPGPLTENSIVHLTKQYDDGLHNDPTIHIMVARDSPSNDIISYAVWHLVPQMEPDDIEEQMMTVPDTKAFPASANIELGQRLIKNSVRKRHEVASKCFGMGKPYLFLAAIGTDPSHQRRGAASALVKWGVDRADEMKNPIYVEGTPAALALYRRHAFEDYDHLVLDLRPIDDGLYTNICFVRHPTSL